MASISGHSIGISDNMKTYSRFVVITTLAVYLLIFVGGLVRVSGAGLGCPDWPQCFGRWIPPLHPSQLPVGFDSSEFNFTLAWIEYINRLIGVMVGLLVAITGFWAIKSYRKNLRILIPAVLAALLVAYQGWQGSRVVASELEPVMVSIHMGVAFIIASLLVYLSVQGYLRSRDRDVSISKKVRKFKLKAGLLWILAVVQVILGTQVREGIETVIEQMPLASHMKIIAGVGAVGHIHSGFGVLIGLGTIVLAYGLLTGREKQPSLLWQSGWALIGLAVIQMIVGIVLYVLHLPEVMQVLHMWLAALMTGIILIIFTIASYKPRSVT
jgi:cytochrome c oxidase assembly protein subunit 15